MSTSKGRGTGAFCSRSMAGAACALLLVLAACAEDRVEEGADPVVDDAPTRASAASSSVTADVTAGVTTDNPPATVAAPGTIPSSPQRSGDPVEGRRALVEEAYVECGLPTRVVRSLLADTEVVALPDRESAASGLPYSVNVSTDAAGVELATSNCLTCHATPLFGELVIGLGNEFADFTGDPSIPVERAGALVRGPLETAAWERYADRVAAIAPFMQMRTVGANPANNLTFALIARRDAETNAWLDSPSVALPPKDPPPVSVPPWWRMAKKHAMFNLGEGRGDHARLMMSASMLCTDSIDALETIDAYAPDVAAYIKSLSPPAWPFSIERDKSAAGQAIFEATCSACHGVYATDDNGVRERSRDSYPNRLVPIDEIGTDATLVEQAFDARGQAYIDWFNRSWYGELSTAQAGRGYVAPPLDGIWATAPFLHNGSVPTVRTLLDSSQRPVRWYRPARDAADKEAYDPANLGWRILADDAIGDVPTERIYDTTRTGYGNGGHRFGDHLDDAERDAVIEYLKTL